MENKDMPRIRGKFKLSEVVILEIMIWIFLAFILYLSR